MSVKVSVAEIKAVKALQQKKFRDEQQRFVAEGPKLIQEALASHASIHRVYGTVRPEWLPESVSFSEASTKDLERMSGLKSAPLLLAVVDHPPARTPVRAGDLMLALDGIRDPGNMGTLIRTADWFGACEVLCSEDCVEVTNPKVVQASMGSVFRIPVSSDNLATTLEARKAEGFEVLRAEMAGADALQMSYPKKAIVLIGSESHGIRFASGDASVSIPSFGSAESLNASMAAGILLSSHRRQHGVTKS